MSSFIRLLYINQFLPCTNLAQVNEHRQTSLLLLDFRTCVRFKSLLLREKKDLKRSFFRGENNYPSAGPGAGQNRRSAACGRKSEAILVTSSEKATDEGSFFVDDGGAAKQFKSLLLREMRASKTLIFQRFRGFSNEHKSVHRCAQICARFFVGLG